MIPTVSVLLRRQKSNATMWMKIVMEEMSNGGAQSQSMASRAKAVPVAAPVGKAGGGPTLEMMARDAVKQRWRQADKDGSGI